MRTVRMTSEGSGGGNFRMTSTFNSYCALYNTLMAAANFATLVVFANKIASAQKLEMQLLMAPSFNVRPHILTRRGVQRSGERISVISRTPRRPSA